ncbi:hypothetical protein Ddye_014623 [Dipteronia dyeriana]|uniref:MULE transposase domain-containing protein n=1 Tax=Dipteronia dyeriana TaxID=168575 RepID=A0AAD9X8M3_9ROSI|nr:hypothetical protein Ddye_014623 [Dipteronia dyeriana]
MCGVPPEVADHGYIAGPQLDEFFGCQIKMNVGQDNHQYNEMYNDMNNEWNNEPNFGPIHEVANEANLHPVNNVVNNEEDEEPVQIERNARRVHRCSSSTVDIARTSEVRPNVTEADSDNAITWKVKRSNKTMLHLVCLMDNCTWKLRAVRRDEVTYFQVRCFFNEHTCPLEEIHRHHRQASAVISGEVVVPGLQQQDGRLMRPKDIIVDIKTMYDIQIMYSKAYQALDYALSLTYETHEETFQLLSSFGYVLKEKNLGTITDLQCDEDGKFLYFFMSLGASLRVFRRCLRPVIAVDGTHLKGKFGGTMFVTTAQDGNEQVYPIAFGHSDSKNNLSWEWFLDCLKGVMAI